MKFLKKRILVLLLVFCVLLQTSALAVSPEDTPVPADFTEETEPTEPVEFTDLADPADLPDPAEPEEPTEPEEEEDPLAGYTFPDNWAGPGLRFAVLNGILTGRGNYDLAPTANTSRAEMATMLVRILGAVKTADTSAFTDMNPDSWYVDPLAKALSLGIFSGTSATTMEPNRPITRQEACVAIARTFGMTPKETNVYMDFADSQKIADYARLSISALVERGCITGRPGNLMDPTAKITRQEVAAILYRLIDTICEDPADIPEEGYVVYRGAETLPAGFTHNGTLVLGAAQPEDLLIDGWKIYDSLVIRCPADSHVTVTASCDILKLCLASSGTLDGSYRPDELVTMGKGSTINLNASTIRVYGPATVNGTYFDLEAAAAPIRFNGYVPVMRVISGTKGEALTVNGEVSVIVVKPQCKNATLVVNRDLEGLVIEEDTSATTATVNGNLDLLIFRENAADANVTVNGTLKDLTVGSNVPRLKLTLRDAGDIIIPEGCDGAVITVSGNAGDITVQSPSCTIQGAGYAKSISVYARRCTVTLRTGKQVSSYDAGLDGVTVTLATSNTISKASPSATITATFQGLQDCGVGITNGSRPVKLYWYVDGKLMSTTDNFMLSNGATATYTYTVGSNPPSKDPVVKAIITLDKDVAEGVCTQPINTSSWDYSNALNIVQTVNIDGYTTCRTYLYSDSSRSSVKRTLASGTHVTHLYFCNDASQPGKVRLDDGTVGWINWSDYQVSRDKYYQTDDYSTAAKEGFVNQKGYTSSTKYMIWVSLKTQRVNVFTGSKGNWTLSKTYLCATGTNITPTCTGVYYIYSKTPRWRFDGYVDGKYTDDATRVYNVSIFWGGQALHSIIYNSKDDSVSDGNLGMPRSHGCVRLAMENATYIYQNIPINTRVVVY